MMMLLLKVPALILLHGMFQVKVAWAPFVHIPVTMLCHIASVHAAGQYGSIMRYNSWVQHLVGAVNWLMFRLVKRTFQFVGEPPPEIMAELELPEAFFTTGQCLVCLWSLVQACISWTCLLMRAREELNERRAFLAALHLPYQLEWEAFWDSNLHLAAVHFLACVHLVIVCPSFFPVEPTQAALHSSILQ